MAESEASKWTVYHFVQLVKLLRNVQKREGKGYKTTPGADLARTLEHQVDAEIARLQARPMPLGDQAGE